MSKIKLSFERCKACYLCMENCPQQAISVSGKVNAKGHEDVEVD